MTGEAIGQRMSSLGANWEDGRADAAPLLNVYSWERPCLWASPSQEHRAPPGQGDGAEADAHPPLLED
eukprot:4396629-Alexandrium_andersonii.AAC.1